MIDRRLAGADIDRRHFQQRIIIRQFCNGEAVPGAVIRPCFKESPFSTVFLQSDSKINPGRIRQTPVAARRNRGDQHFVSRVSCDFVFLIEQDF